MHFFGGLAFLGWVSSCLLMVNLKAATTKPPTQTLKTLNPKPSYCTTTVLLMYY